MKTIKLKWYSDPGHSWLRISRKDADYLGILPKVTSYSYQSKHGNVLYLEEDQDADLVLQTLMKQGDRFKPFWECGVTERDRQSGVRKLAAFTHEPCHTVNSGAK